MTDTFLADVARVEEQDRVRRQQGTVRTAASSLVQAQGVSPESAAAAARAGAFLGLPAPAVRADPSLVQDARVQQDRQTLETAPHTANAYVDHEFANVAHDQVGALAGLERLVDGIFGKGKLDANVDTFRRFGGDLLTGLGSGFQGLATTAQTFDRYSQFRPLAPRYGALEAPLNEIGASFKAAGADVSGTRPLYFQRNSGADTGLAGDVVGGLGQITGQVLVGAATGGTATLPLLYGQGVDQMNDRVVTDMAQDGRAERTVQDDIAAQAGGVVTAATEKIGLDRILHAVPSAVKNNIMRRLTDIAVAGITEGTTEALEQVGQNALSINLLGTPGGLTNYVDGAPDAAAPASLVGSIARLAVQAAIPGVQHVHTANAAAAATVDQAAFEQAVEAVTSNPLLERSPERFRQYLASATDNANVYVPADAAREFFQSHPELDQWLDEWDIRDQYEQALTAGTDIAIPTAVYLTQVAPTEAHAAFSQDLRLGPDAMSLREVQDFEAKGEENLSAAVDSAVQSGVQQQADEAPVERVRADIFDQLRSAGVSVEVARQNAVLVAARARTRAQRSPDLYPDAWAAYTADGGLKVQAEVPASVQRESDRLDVVIEVMRNRNGAPTQRALKGQSLLEFLSDNGGVTDTGGELAAMGAGAFNRPSQGGRSGRRPVVRAEGGNAFGSDYAAQRAVEAGYLPEGADGNALFNAMREEIAGRPIYSASYARDAAAESTVEAAGDLEALLPTLGLDQTATNDEIRAAVAKMGDGVGNADATFNQDDDALGPKRGNIRFTDAGATITLFKAKDRSTFLHEISHKWLDELVIDGTHESASPEVKADLDKVLAWFSENAGKPITVDDIGVDQHELWARGGEVFFLEGKAPSAELRPAFRRFTEWLKGVYRSVLALNAPVSQPVREVMGRLIATDEEISAVQQAQALNRLFATPEDAGMTKDEFARYTAADNVAQAGASARLMKKTMEPLRRERTLEWKNEREALRPRQTEIVDALPDIAAIRTLTETGERINRQALIDLYGSDRVLKLLPRGKTAFYADDGTVHPDALADAVGATSGETLVNALMSNQAERQARKAQGDNRSVRDARIEDRLDAEMEFLHGDPLNDGSLEEEALNAVHEKRRADLLATEASQLAKMAGTPALWTREGIEAYARDTVLNLRASKLRPGAYLRAERKAGIEAQRALLKGKHAEALDAKLLQSVNFALYRAALDAQQAIEKGENLFARVVTAKDKTTAKSRNFDMVNAARSILAGYGVARKGGEAVKSYMDALKAYDPDAYAALAEVVDEAMLSAKPMDDLTVGEFNDLHATIDQLWTLSRETQNSMIEGRKVENEVIRGELVADLAKDGPPKERPGKAQAVTKAERRNRALWSVRNFFGRVEEYALRRGPAFTKYVWHPVSQAGDAYRTLQRTHLPALQVALETLAEDVHKVRRIEAPEIDYTFGASEITGVMEIVGALRHVGNPSNYRKLLLGRGWGSENADGSLNDASFRAMLDRLHRDGVIQKRHWDYVQAEWDLHETVKPEVQRAHRRMTGAYFEEVTAASVATPFGVYAGGYVPAKVDPNIDSRAAEFDLQGILANGANGSFNFPSATNGFTKGRVDYNRPLNLDVRQAISQFSEVMRYATLGPAVQDVNRILRERQFADTLDSYDTDVWNEFLQPWLTRAVSQRVNTPSTSKFGSLAERTLNTVASRAGTAIMMGNVLNAAQQVTGLAPAALRTGKRNLANSMRLYVANPAAMTRQVAELSPMMANRMGTQMRDLTDAARDISIAPNLLEQAVNFTDRHKYFMQTGVQNMLDPMIWTAAYNRALSANDENPVAYADSVIRTTQDSYAAEGATNFAAGPAWANALKMFTGYFVGQANLLATEVARTRDLPPAQKAVRLAEIYTLGVLVTAVGSEAILEALTGTLGDEDNDGWFDDLADLFLMSQIRYLLAFVPIGGAVANSVLNRFDDRPYNDKLSLSPVTSSVEALGSSAVDVQKAAQGKGDASRTVKDFGSLITTFTGLPTFQKQTGYVADVLEGDVEPTSAADAARGFVSGRASKESRTDQ